MSARTLTPEIMAAVAQKLLYQPGGFTTVLVAFTVFARALDRFHLTGEPIDDARFLELLVYEQSLIACTLPRCDEDGFFDDEHVTPGVRLREREEAEREREQHRVRDAFEKRGARKAHVRWWELGKGIREAGGVYLDGSGGLSAKVATDMGISVEETSSKLLQDARFFIEALSRHSPSFANAVKEASQP